jgi:hypothetical protein
MSESTGWEWFADAPDPRDGPVAATRFVVESVLILGLAVRGTAHVLTHSVLHHDSPEDVPHPLDVTFGLRLGNAVREPALTARQDLHCRYGSFAFAVLVVPLFASSTYFSWTPATAAFFLANAALLVGDPLWWAIHHGRQYIAGSAGDGAPAQAEPEAASEGD